LWRTARYRVHAAEAERETRTEAKKDFCVVRDRNGEDARWFVRALIPFTVIGRETPCCWGVWCEVSAQDYAKVRALWDDSDQCAHPPFDAMLANDVDGYPPTAGLEGTVRFLDPTQIPYFAFASHVTHPMANETRAGVSPARVLEWLAPYLHGAAASRGGATNEWPFDQAPNVASITTRFVLDDGLPVVLVIHYSDDHSWAFLCGTSGEAKDGRVISMKSALNRDPTLAEVADLPPGWKATREDIGEPWHRVYDPEM
jgi:hypothetical protein